AKSLYSTKVECRMPDLAGKELLRRARDDLRAAMYAELRISATQMFLDGVFANRERVADLLVREAAAHVTDDFVFAAREPGVGARFERSVVRCVQVLEQQLDEQRTRQPHLSPLDGAHGFHARGRRVGCEQETLEAIAHDVLGERGAGTIPDEQDSLARPTRTHARHRAGSETAQPPLLEQQHVGPILFEPRSELCCVAGSADERDDFMLGSEPRCPTSRERFVAQRERDDRAPPRSLECAELVAGFFRSRGRLHSCCCRRREDSRLLSPNADTAGSRLRCLYLT